MGNTLSMIRNMYDQGFNIPSPTLTEKNLPDQDGKVFIVTGSNVGVGYELASILYSRHGTVYLACRSSSKANAAIDTIKSAHPTSRGQLHYLHLDLSDLTSIKKSASTFLSQATRLDWLCNNAGIMVPPKGSKTALGHELQFGTNVLGPFLFTKLLVPMLKRTAEAAPASSVRVSWAGSFGVESSPKGGIQFTTDSTGRSVPKDFGGGIPAYASSKVANLWLAHEFGVRTNASSSSPSGQVLYTSFNPGNLKSNLQSHANEQYGALVMKPLEWLMLHPARFGAYTELYTGLSQELTVEKDQGAYFLPWGRKARRVREDVLSNIGEGKGSTLLWEWCERETNAYM